MSIAAWLLGSKIGQTILLVIVGFIGFGWYTIHERDIGEAKAKAAEAAAAQAQLEQVQQALEAAQQEAQQALAAQHKLELDNEKLLAAISATRPHDSDACLGGDDASMLDQIAAPQQRRVDGDADSSSAPRVLPIGNSMAHRGRSYQSGPATFPQVLRPYRAKTP